MLKRILEWWKNRDVWVNLHVKRYIIIKDYENGYALLTIQWKWFNKNNGSIAWRNDRFSGEFVESVRSREYEAAKLGEEFEYS